MNCVHLFRRINKLKSHENVCKYHNGFHVKIPEEFNKTLKYNQSEKSMKIPLVICADMEKVQTCDNNVNKSITTKLNKHPVCAFSIFGQCSIDATKSKIDYSSDEGCMKKFYRDLREHTSKITSYKQMEIIPLTDEENQSCHNQTNCHISKK